MREGLDMSPEDLALLQAYREAFYSYFGWDAPEVDEIGPDERATVAALRAAIATLTHPES